MGFWHTGYMEFHEKVGLEGYEFRPSTREYPCPVCGEVFTTADELQTHRLEQHPLRRPALIVRGAETGSRPVIVTSKLKPTDIALERCVRVLVNGREIPVERLGEDLAARSWETCHLVDTRRRPPEEQNLEKLYYQPCSVCGRASNDPACKCASALYDDTRKNFAPTPETAEGRMKGSRTSLRS